MGVVEGCVLAIGARLAAAMAIVTRAFNSHHPSDIRSPCMVHAPGLVTLDL